ncbi:serine protease filzig-like [Anopheles maculipalpis]|nr:serine protease filzig-like [Anopheles maculipalpis]
MAVELKIGHLPRRQRKEWFDEECTRALSEKNAFLHEDARALKLRHEIRQNVENNKRLRRQQTLLFQDQMRRFEESDEKLLEQKELLYALLLLSVYVKISHQKTSPCPAVFSYDERDDSYDTWFGTLRLKSNVPLYGIFVDIIFSSPVLSFGTFLRQHNTDDNVHFHIMDKSYRVRAGEVVIVKFFVRYAPDRPVPLLRQIRFNGQNICTETRQIPAQSSGTRATGTNYGNPHIASSSETEDIIADVYTPVVQPINSHVTHPPVESHVQPLYSSSSASSSRSSSSVATRATDEKISYTSSPRASDVYPPRFSTDDQVEHSSHSNGRVNEKDDQDADRHRVANRRITTTTYRAIAEERKWDVQPTQRSQSSDASRSPNRVSSVPLIADKGFTTLAPISGTTAAPVSNQQRDRDQYFAGDYAFLQQDSSPKSPQPHYINKYEGDICGTVVPKANPLVTHGTVSERGQFPWHGALYRSTVTELKYLCGATLISRRASITAAHCVTLEKSTKPVDAGSLLLYFGKIDLGKWNGPEEDAQIRAIHIPAQYQHERFFNDIAVLVLKEDVKYSNFVRPVCLWNFDDDYKTLINKIGLVPGWGYNEHGLVSSRLSFAQMPVVAHETCIWSNRDFFSKVTSDTSFCAGFKNGTSVCNGDSGGGMVFKHNNLWYLRGIVSVSAALQDRFHCDSKHYVVFTDAAKFTSWIRSLM